MHIHRCKRSKSDGYCLPFSHPTIDQCLDIDSIPDRSTANSPKMYPIDYYKSSSMVNFVRRPMPFDTICHPVRKMLTMHLYAWRRKTRYFYNHQNDRGTVNMLVSWIWAQSTHSVYIAYHDRWDHLYCASHTQTISVDVKPPIDDYFSWLSHYYAKKKKMIYKNTVIFCICI